MTIIKCKMCGGDIQRSKDEAYGTCDSCGSTMTFPKVSDEQRANLFNRANHFRRQGEFDKAIAAYESILNQDDSDAEAHWGVVLSRYGIEYVEDPTSHERVPTCRRAQIESILNDADYLAALEHAPDGYSRSLYEAEAKRIAEIQKGILTLSAQEKPYNVFICYKETTDTGTRTSDSALAQDVYYQLVQEGYKVFFSRITLEDKLGQQYEPYIFAALNSAKVMVVIGTQAEYFNAVWVKNEWSRFLALMKKDRSKVLIPCYKGMDAYDLPEALSMLQSQDMGKIGFIQDLVRGIKKVVDADKTKRILEATARTGEIAAAPSVQSLLRRAQLFLEDGDFTNAAEYADKVLDIDPEHAPAYMARLQALLRMRSENELGNYFASLEQYGDYQKAVRFADGKMKPVYHGYNQRILDRLEEERKESIYQAANKQYCDARNLIGFQLAAGMFQTIPGFKDADELSLVSQAKAEEARLAELKREEEARAEQSRREAEWAVRAEQDRIADKKRRKRNKLIVILVLAVLVLVLYVTQVIIPQGNYQKAMDLLASKQYDEAAAAFEALGSYSDSTSMIKESAYQKGKALADHGYYKEALTILIGLKDYKDTASLITGNAGLSAAAAAAMELDREYSVGNTVTFGAYEQDNNTTNGKENIRWRVLAREDDEALLISVDILDSQPFEIEANCIYWERCSLRTWLNNDFLNAAFTREQQEAILNTLVKGEDSEKEESYGDNDTIDKVFLLSFDEAITLFASDEDRVAKNTAYTVVQDAYTSDNGAGNWWLRWVTGRGDDAHIVHSDGDIDDCVKNYETGVRPALWLNLSSDIFTSETP